jgi:hypothetical protein
VEGRTRDAWDRPSKAARRACSNCPPAPRLAGSRRGIESLLVKEQADPLVMEALEYAEQVGERSAKPIH